MNAVRFCYADRLTIAKIVCTCPVLGCLGQRSFVNLLNDFTHKRAAEMANAISDNCQRNVSLKSTGSGFGFITHEGEVELIKDGKDFQITIARAKDEELQPMLDILAKHTSNEWEIGYTSDYPGGVYEQCTIGDRRQLPAAAA